MSQLWLFPRTRGLGAVERNSFRFFLADRFARSNGPNGTEKRTVLGELHRDLSYLMTGKGAWVAGADRREAPGPKPEHLGRRLRLRQQPPRSWQMLNRGDQRGVAKNGMNSVLPRTSEALASWCATMSKLGRLRPPKMAACHPPWRTNWRAPSFFCCCNCDQGNAHFRIIAEPAALRFVS